MRQVKAGRDLSSMERIPNPVAPPQLAVLQSMMMRGQGFFPIPRAPFGMGMLRAQMGVAQPQMGVVQPQMGGAQPHMGVVPVSMVSVVLEPLFSCAIRN